MLVSQIWRNMNIKWLNKHSIWMLTLTCKSGSESQCPCLAEGSCTSHWTSPDSSGKRRRALGGGCWRSRGSSRPPPAQTRSWRPGARWRRPSWRRRAGQTQQLSWLSEFKYESRSFSVVWEGFNGTLLRDIMTYILWLWTGCKIQNNERNVRHLCTLCIVYECQYSVKLDLDNTIYPLIKIGRTLRHTTNSVAMR